MTTIKPNFETICINPNDDLVLYDKKFINSRIEKYLYALCTLDASDLPHPLSRIEVLYRGLVIGDITESNDNRIGSAIIGSTVIGGVNSDGVSVNFSSPPLSRAEEYLLACLGVYISDELPNPQSRSEVLLYKLATDDYNLDDVKCLKSRYEFLLAYIIKNGGINKDDFEYITYTFTSKEYTLYNTIEKPIKNVVLKGDTFITKEDYNLVDMDIFKTPRESEVYPYSVWRLQLEPNTNYVANSTFTKPDNNSYDSFSSILRSDYSEWIYIYHWGANLYANNRLFTTDETGVIFLGVYKGTCPYDIWDIVDLTIIKEGQSTTPVVISKNVKNPVLTTIGTNTFDIKNEGSSRMGWFSIPSVIPFNGEVYIKGSDSLPSDFRVCIMTGSGAESEHTISNDDVKNGHTDQYQNVVSIDFHCPTLSILGGGRGNLNELVANGDFIIKLGGDEIYRANTLTVDGGIELRGIDDIKDELDLVTGSVTRRISDDNKVLNQPILETVNMLIKDQDGNDIPGLSTFEGITHILLSSGNLIPEVTLDAAIKTTEE